jgi:hypothetical protein
VPADRRASALRELEPVFAALAGVIGDSETIRTEAATGATAYVAEAAERARILIARAQRDSDAERAATAAALRAQAEDAARQHVAEAEIEAAEVRRLAEARRPELLQRVLDRVRADLMGVVGSASATGVEQGRTRPSQPESSP